MGERYIDQPAPADMGGISSVLLKPFLQAQHYPLAAQVSQLRFHLHALRPKVLYVLLTYLEPQDLHTPK